MEFWHSQQWVETHQLVGANMSYMVNGRVEMAVTMQNSQYFRQTLSKPPKGDPPPTHNRHSTFTTLIFNQRAVLRHSCNGGKKEESNRWKNNRTAEFARHIFKEYNEVADAWPFVGWTGRRKAGSR